MWIFYALGSAVFAGLTAILAKIGMKNTDSHLGTALRTVVVLVFSWIMVLVKCIWRCCFCQFNCYIWKSWN